MELSLDLVEIMLNEVEETGEPVKWNNISLSLKGNNIYVDYIQQRNYLLERIFPYNDTVWIKSHNNLNSLYEQTFKIIKEYVNIEIFTDLFVQEMKNKNYQLDSPTRYSKEFDENLIFVRFSDFLGQNNIDSIVISINWGNEPLIVIPYRDVDNKWFNNEPRELFFKFREKLHKLEKAINEIDYFYRK